MAAYSDDGINWKESEELPDASLGNWWSVTYGKGKFVAIAESSSAIVAYSIDGIHWEPARLPFPADLYQVCYGNGKFLAVNYSQHNAAYSTDGITWKESKAFPFVGNWSVVGYGDGKFIVAEVQNVLNIIVYSTDGINWTKMPFPSGVCNTITYGLDDDIFGFL
jgi:hypothetical protein